MVQLLDLNPWGFHDCAQDTAWLPVSGFRRRAARVIDHASDYASEVFYLKSHGRSATSRDVKAVWCHDISGKFVISTDPPAIPLAVADTRMTSPDTSAVHFGTDDTRYSA
jgi:hypothetical protein